MSHTVKINIEFKQAEFPLLVRSFRRLGWDVKTENLSGGQFRTYQGSSSTGQFFAVAINPKKESNAYDIGLMVEKEKITLHTDLYGGSVESTLGREFGKLKQEFAVSLVEDEYPNATVTRSLDKEGNVLLDVEEWG